MIHNKESAGKKKRAGTRKGDMSLKEALVHKDIGTNMLESKDSLAKKAVKTFQNLGQ